MSASAMPPARPQPGPMASALPGPSTAGAIGGVTGIVAAGVTRLVALLAVVFFLVFPVAALFTAPTVALSTKAAWLALIAIACVRPRWSPFVLVALAPLVPWLPIWSPGIPHGVVHLIVLSQALPWLLRYAAGRAPRVADGLTWAWALFVAVAIASVCTHYLAYRAVFETWALFWTEARGDLGRYVLDPVNIELENMIIATTVLIDGWLTYLIVRSSLDRAGLIALLSAACWTAVAVALFGIAQVWTGLGLSPVWAIYDPGIIRINATFTDPNTLASYFALVVPLTLALAGVSAGRRRIAWLVAAAIMAAALIMTAGRAGLLATCLGVGTLLALVVLCDLDRLDPWAWMRRHFRSIVYAVAALGLAALVALSAAGTILDIRHHHQNSYLHTWLFTFNLRQPLDQIVKGRLSNWETAALMVQDRPVFGIGVGRIFRFFAYYNRTVGGAPEGARLSAHNTFLNVAAEMGVVGLAAWLVLLGGAFAIAIGAVRRAAASGDRAIAWPLVGLLAALTGYAFTMIPGDRLLLREDLVSFAAVLAAIAGLRALLPAAPSAAATAPASSSSSSSSTSAHGRWLPRLAAAAMVAVLATVPMRAAGERRLIRLERVTFGMYGVEDARGVRARWTMGRATFHQPTAGGELKLELRSLAPFPQHVAIRLNGVAIDKVALADHTWRTLRYPLPARARSSPYAQIDLEVDPVWRAGGDPRELGVMVLWEGR